MPTKSLTYTATISTYFCCTPILISIFTLLFSENLQTIISNFAEKGYKEEAVRPKNKQKEMVGHVYSLDANVWVTIRAGAHGWAW